MKTPGKVVCAVVMAVVLIAAFLGGCSKNDFNKQVVATVNGEEISVLDAREYLGAPAGSFAFDGMQPDQKMMALDQLIGIRLAAQAGKAMGLDNTLEYKNIFEKNEIGVTADALIRRELIKKLKLNEKEMKAEAEKIRKEKAGVTDADATLQASMAIMGRKLREIQKELIETARKETKAAIDNNALELIGKGERIPDNAVLASAGDEKIFFSDVEKVIRETPMLSSYYGQGNPEITRTMVEKVVEQGLILRSLKAYAARHGVEGSREYKTSVLNMERAIIANLMFENVVGTVMQASDEEVRAEYNRRVKEMQNKGQAPPYKEVKEQLREIVNNFKRQSVFEEYIEKLRNEGTVTVNEDIFQKL